MGKKRIFSRPKDRRRKRRFLRAGLFASAFLLALPIFPAPASGDPGDQEYSKGRAHAAAGRGKEAAAAFRKAIALNPDHVEARYQLALIHMKSVLTYEGAEKYLLELPEVAMRAGGKTRDDILFRSGLALGQLYIKSGRHPQAIPLLRNIIASAPMNTAVDEAHNALGLAYYYERLYDEAIFELRKAIKINPNNRQARFNLKTTRARLEHYHAGKIYSRMGDREEAIAQFRRAIELDPRFVDARARLGVELMAEGQYAEALKELRRADSISSNYRKAYEIWYSEGLTLVRLGRSDEAMERFLKTIEARPTFASAHNEAGKIHLERGEYDEAIQYFVRAIGIDPRTEYVRNLQIAFSKKGN